jgi:hypothetical protein
MTVDENSIHAAHMAVLSFAIVVVVVIALGAVRRWFMARRQRGPGR